MRTGTNAGAWILGAACLLATACGPGGESAPAVERLEEGGVQIVVSGRPAWDDEAGSLVHIWLLDAEGRVLRDFGESPGDDRAQYESAIMPRPLGKITVQALTTERAYIGTADAYEIQVWSLDGTLRQRWRRATGDLSIGEDEIGALLAEESSDSLLGQQLRFLRRELTDPPIPEALPAYSRFVVDATDHLWVENYRLLGRGPHRWSIFAPDGVWLGELEVPDTFDVTDIGEDYVLGVYRDELDEQSIRMYGLVRT